MRHSNRNVFTCAVLLLLLTIGERDAQGQIIFFSPCQNFIPQFQTESITLWVCVEGQIATGITSVQFRIDGVPQDWIASAVAKPPFTLTGNQTVAAVQARRRWRTT